MRAEHLEFEFDLEACRQSGALYTVEGRSALCDGALLEAILSAVRAAGASAALADLELHAPLWIESDRTAAIAIDVASLGFELRSRGRDDDGRFVLHASGRAASAATESAAAAASNLGPEALALSTHAEFYAVLADAGLSWPPAHRLVERVVAQPDLARARIRVAPQSLPAGPFTLHPAVLDAVLQVVAFMVRRAGSAANRVASVRTARVVRTAPACRLVVERSASDPGWHAALFADDGSLVAELDGIRFETAERQHARAVELRTAEAVGMACAALGIGDLEPCSDLVQAGASSLDLTRLLSALRGRWGWAPRIDRLLLEPTPAALVRWLMADEPERRDPTPWFEDDGSEPAVGTPPATAVSHVEQRLWYLERFGRVAPAYNEAATWQIDGDLDRAALERALQQIADSHDILRTSFPEAGGLPQRVVAAEAQLALQTVDLSAEQDARVPESALAAEAKRPFDLGAGPLLRALLFKLGERRHVLLIVAHHIVCDGGSLALLRAELERRYRAVLQGGAPQPSRALHMADYAAWEQQRDASYLTALLDFWVAELADAPTLLELPTDHPRPRSQTHRGARLAFELDVATGQSLRAFSRRIGATPFAVLLAAFQVLVYRHSGQSRFLLGVPFSLRDGQKLETVLGCLVNTVPIRAELGPGATLLDVIEQTRVRVARALARKHVPLDQLVARLRCDRSLSRTPLLQVAFAYDDASSSFALPGCAVTELSVDTGTAKFDLTLHVVERAGRVSGHIEYATDLYDPRRIALMAHHFRRIVAQIAQDATVDAGGEWLFDPPERAELARVGQGARSAADGDLLQRIEHHLRHGGARTAVVCADGAISYCDLARDVDRIAAGLAPHLDAGDAPIGLCTGRSRAWVAAMLAILRLGRGYLPIDPQTPRVRALHALHACGSPVLLYAEGQCDFAGEFGGCALPLSCQPPAGAAATPRAIAAGAPGRTFYAITTSGSTGTPKTAAVSYQGFSNLHAWYCGALAVEADARVLVATSVAFDLTQKNVFAALAHGARVVLRNESMFDPAELAALVEREQITVLNCTPSLFYPLVERPDAARYAQLRSLRHVVLGGEPIERKRLEAWLASEACVATLMNSYGPTECTDVCTACTVDRGGPLEETVPIGRAIPNVTLSVRDPAGRLVPLGTAGELYIAGAALGVGYLGPTALQSGFVDLDSGPAYRSGDLVRFRWDGQLEFLGRVDHQVKVRGHRINLEEIESALRKHPSVADAAVAVRGTGEAASALSAYYVADAELDRSELRSWLCVALPRYMVPSSFMRLAQLPLTRSGKVDRLRLPEPNGVVQRPPRGDLEQTLQALFRSVLAVAQLGVEDDFFEVGGHSLLAIRLAEQIELTLRRPCRVSDVFEHPTVQQLAELLRRRTEHQADVPGSAG